MPLMVATHYLIADLKRCYSKEQKETSLSNIVNRIQPMTFGGLQTMWIIVLFDLPTDTKVGA